MRQLSSWFLTFTYKYLLPLVWIPVFAFASVSLAVEGSPQWPGFAIVTVVGAAAISWLALSIRTVHLEGETLVVASRSGISRIPMSNVERVSGSLLFTPELVRVHFKRPTQCGKTVTILPPLRFSFGLSRHPLVRELERLRLNAIPSQLDMSI